MEPLEDPVAAVEEAIRDPIGSAPLWEIIAPGQTVAFIVCEPARALNTHVFLPVMVDEVHAVGVPYEDMSVVFASDGRRVMSRDEMAQEAGGEVAARVGMYSGGRDFYSDERVAAARHIILTGAVTRRTDGLTGADSVDSAVSRRPSFLLNVVLNEENRILKVFAGNYILARREACAFAGRTC